MLALKFLAVPLIVIYGLLAILAGPQQWRLKRIPAWSANAMIAAGVLLLVSAYLLFSGSSLTLPVLAIGLVGMHILAIANGQHMNGKITWSDHIGRLGLSLVIFGLSFWALN